MEGPLLGEGRGLTGHITSQVLIRKFQTDGLKIPSLEGANSAVRLITKFWFVEVT